MTLHPLDLALILAPTLAEAILAYVILKKNAARRWPFLLALCLFDLFYGAMLATHLGSYRSYFYVYWYGQGLRSFVMLGILWDIFRAFPELKYVPKRLGLVLFCAGLTITIGSVILTTLHHPNATNKIEYEILMVRECVTVLWFASAISLLKSISFLGLGWGLESVNVAAGAVAFGLAGMIAASLTSWRPHYGPLLNNLQTCTETAVFLSWIKTLCHSAGSLVPDSALNPNELLEEQPLV